MLKSSLAPSVPWSYFTGKNVKTKKMKKLKEVNKDEWLNKWCTENSMVMVFPEHSFYEHHDFVDAIWLH